MEIRLPRSEISGVQAEAFSECSGEVARVGIADCIGGLEHAGMRLRKEFACVFHAFLSQVAEYGCIESFAKSFFEFEFVEAYLTADFGEGVIGGEIGFQIGSR